MTRLRFGLALPGALLCAGLALAQPAAIAPGAAPPEPPITSPRPPGLATPELIELWRDGIRLERGIALRPTYKDDFTNSTLGNLYYAGAVFYRVVPEWIWLDWLIGVRGDIEKSLDMIRQAARLDRDRIDYQVEMGAILLCYAERRGAEWARVEGQQVLEATPDLRPRFRTDEKWTSSTLRGCWRLASWPAVSHATAGSTSRPSASRPRGSRGRGLSNPPAARSRTHRPVKSSVTSADDGRRPPDSTWSTYACPTSCGASCTAWPNGGDESSSRSPSPSSQPAPS